MYQNIEAVLQGFQIKTFDCLTTRELYEILKARADIFTREEQILYPDADGLDDQCMHVYKTDESGTVTAYLRAFPKEGEENTVQFGRVLTRRHGTGEGMQLIHAAIQASMRYLHAEEIYLESQKHAEGFYEKAGFQTCSEVFLEAGIPHVQMRKKLHIS